MKRREFIKLSAAGATAMSGLNLFASEAKFESSKMIDVKFNNGVKMPILGLGVWKIPDLKECQRVVEDAFNAGYRMIDTAQAYRNEEAVGAAFSASGLKRDEVFITSKIATQNLSMDGVLRSFEESMKKLGLKQVDLMLLHAPAGDALGAWKGLESLYKQGRVRAIGISNFYGKILKELLDKSEIKPVLNQVETHPYLQHFAVQKEFEAYGMIMQAWSQFGNGMNGVLKEPILAQIGQKYNKTAAQVILRWLIQRGVSVIPKTTHKERLLENIDVFDFSLSDEDFTAIAKLERNERLFSGWGREDI
ncbi:MAG: aldo/keto reductase [Campylobacter sp.]|nr:aldo/keto reductase [Campylobacter sp.]